MLNLYEVSLPLFIGSYIHIYSSGPGFEPGSGHMEFVVDKVALGRFSPSTSVTPANLHSTNCSTITLIDHLGFVQ
jgi:hypothetical protein